MLAWALWDSGDTGLNATVVTFVFSVYLTDTVGAGLPDATTPASWLGRALTAAAVVVAVLAPIIGVWVEAPRRRRCTLAVLTGLAVLLTAAMSLIRADPHYLWIGLVLLACTAACSELATVPYNAMLPLLSTPQTVGRISGFGWAAGYVGSVALLLVVYFGFISGDGSHRGRFAIPADDGQNVSAAMLVTAVWVLLFGLPVLLTIPTTPTATGTSLNTGVRGAYRRLWSDIVGEWRRDRHVIYFLLASAVFRDGLAGVFAFGAVLGVTVYGLSAANVLMFGIAASVVAAFGAVGGGLLDDRVGSKPVIVGSLASMIVAGLALLALSGQAAFWVCGLVLSLFVGPAQASARTMLARMTRGGREGVAFGLYTMTGRAVSFLSPLLFFTFIDLFGTERAGMGGLIVVLAAGLVAMLVLRDPT